MTSTMNNGAIVGSSAHNTPGGVGVGGMVDAAAAGVAGAGGADATTHSVVLAARETLCQLVQEYLMHLVREAATVASRHSTTAPATASASAASPPLLLLSVRHVNMVLQWRGQDALYGVSSSSSTTPESASELATTNDKEGAPVLDLNDYVRREWRVKPPCEVGMVTHWMAVNGKMTQLHQMLLAAAAKRQQEKEREEEEEEGMGEEKDGEFAKRGAKKRLVSSLYQRDDDDDDDDGGDGLELARKLKSAKASSSAMVVASSSSPSLSVRQLLPRILSEELRLYFYRVTLAMEVPPNGKDEEEEEDDDDDDDEDNDDDEEDFKRKRTKNSAAAAIRSVRRDVGLQELVPFFVKYIADEIMNAKRRCRSVRTILQLALALLDNPHLHLELYLHQLLPILITSVVAKRLNTLDEVEAAAAAAAAADSNKEHHHKGHHHHHHGTDSDKDKKDKKKTSSSSSSSSSVALTTTTATSTTGTTTATNNNNTTTTTTTSLSSATANTNTTTSATTTSSLSTSTTPTSHWFLRNDAAQILVKTTRLYGTQYPSLKARIIQTLCKGLYSDYAPLATQYGAIMALAEFGAKTIESFLIPVTWNFWTQWTVAQEESLEMTHCQQAMLYAMNVLLVQLQQDAADDAPQEDATTATTTTTATTSLSTDLEAIFGERLIPFYNETVGLNYNGCFI